MTEYRVADLFGAICVDPEDGLKLCKMLQQALHQGHTVTLDFAGVTTLASAFLNTAVGCLYASFSKQELDQRLRWKGLDPTDDAVMRFVQRNAIRFYSAQSAQQAAILSSTNTPVGK
jgi:STAS-like domain of unknown function (DUF4325)